MTKYHSNDDKIAILSRLKSASDDTDLDTFCQKAGISRRTLSRWSSKFGFDLRSRKWHKGSNVRSLQNLNRGDFLPNGERGHLTTKHGLRSASWLNYRQWTCSRCRWITCPVRSSDADADCLILDQRRDELHAELEASPYVDQTSALAQEWVFVNLSLTLCQIGYRAFGAFTADEKGITSLQSLTRYETKLRDQVIRLSESLGLSVDSKRRLAATQAGVADVASRVAEMRKNQDAKR